VGGAGARRGPDRDGQLRPADSAGAARQLRDHPAAVAVPAAHAVVEKEADLTLSETAKMRAEGVDLYYGSYRALRSISLEIPANRVTALIGPSGCGKSSFLRCLNRMNDLIPGARVEGTITLDGVDIYAPGVDVVALRRRVGMVFQRPNPFPMSIYDNVAYGPRIHGERRKAVLDEIVEQSLRGAALWDEVKDRLHRSALGLSGGQQQRLCIARSLAVKPEVLLMDEPASALDPISTAKIEELFRELRAQYSIVI